VNAQQVGRGAYIALVVVAAVGYAALSFALVKQGDRLDAQQQHLQTHLHLIESTLLAECRTRDVILALSTETVSLLKSLPPTKANEQAIGVFETYGRLLKNDQACNTLQRAVK
jgi:hypothetical protein